MMRFCRLFMGRPSEKTGWWKTWRFPVTHRFANPPKRRAHCTIHYKHMKVYLCPLAAVKSHHSHNGKRRKVHRNFSATLYQSLATTTPGIHWSQQHNSHSCCRNNLFTTCKNIGSRPSSLLLYSAQTICSAKLNRTLSIASVRIYIYAGIIAITIARTKRQLKTPQLNTTLILVSHKSVLSHVQNILKIIYPHLEQNLHKPNHARKIKNHKKCHSLV